MVKKSYIYFCRNLNISAQITNAPMENSNVLKGSIKNDIEGFFSVTTKLAYTEMMVESSKKINRYLLLLNHNSPTNTNGQIK